MNDKPPQPMTAEDALYVFDMIQARLDLNVPIDGDSVRSIAAARTAVAEIIRRNGEYRKALQEIVGYVAVNEMTVSPQYPVAPMKMKEIAYAALTGSDGRQQEKTK